MPFVVGCQDYLGIDPSGEMVAVMAERWPAAKVVQTRLDAFVGATAFDVILALGGVGNYLSDRELGRILHLLKPGGYAVVMFYCEGVEIPAAVTPYRMWSPGLFPGKVINVGSEIACVYRAPQ